MGRRGKPRSTASLNWTARHGGQGVKARGYVGNVVARTVRPQVFRPRTNTTVFFFNCAICSIPRPRAREMLRLRFAGRCQEGSTSAGSFPVCLAASAPGMAEASGAITMRRIKRFNKRKESILVSSDAPIK